MLLQVEVEGRAAGEVLDVAAAVEPELVEDVEPRILHGVEVAVVAAVARHRITVLAVPLGVFSRPRSSAGIISQLNITSFVRYFLL